MPSRRLARRKAKLGLLALTASLIGCSKPAPPTVILDGWWNVDYAKTSCDYAKSTGLGEECVTDPTTEVRAFENQIAMEFAANPKCNSIRFVYFGNPNVVNKAVHDASSDPHWQLMLDYRLGEQQQSWSMVRSGDKTSAYVEGDGDARAITARVCDIVLQRGASIAN